VQFRYGTFDSITNLVTYAGGQARVTRFDYGA
jgi:hypothetical protein